MESQKDIEHNNRWLTIEEATREFGVSERTIYRRLNGGLLESKMTDGRRLVSAQSLADLGGGKIQSSFVEQLGNENDRLIRRIQELEAEIKEKDSVLEANRQRQDTIILQLTRQLDQSQKLLEHHRSPWWRRWFGGRKE